LSDSKLQQLCQPVFSRVISLGISAAAQTSLKGYPNLRTEPVEANAIASRVEALFAELETEAKPEPDLSRKFARVRPVIEFWIDSTLSHSGVVPNWNHRLTTARQALSYESLFFINLKAELKRLESTPEDRDVLEIYRSCLRLGFRGSLADNPSQLKLQLDEIETALAKAGSARMLSCWPDGAEAHLPNTDDRRPPDTRHLRVLSAAFGSLTLVVFLVIITVWVAGRVRASESVHKTQPALQPAGVARP